MEMARALPSSPFLVIDLSAIEWLDTQLIAREPLDLKGLIPDA
jgi:hypothetical protein